jgi:hypothetical protein
MYDFEQIIKENENINTIDVVNKAKVTIPQKIKSDAELLELKTSNPKMYMRKLEDEFPYFADKFPFLFDKIIENPDDLEMLELMLKKLKWTNKRNYETRTQEIVDIVAANNNKTK